MFKKIRMISVVLSFSMVFTLSMAACSSKKNEATTEKTKSTAADTKGSNSNLTDSGFPIVKNPITIKVFGQKSAMQGPWEDMLVFKEYEKKTNVKVIFETAPEQGFAEKKSLLFASNELPDAFVRAQISNDEVTKYGPSGSLIPLETLIEKNAPNIKKVFGQYPDAKKSIVAPDSHIYSLPTLVTLNAGRTQKIWIKKSWLQTVGKAVPTTLTDLEDVLKAFKAKDFNGNGKADELPMTFPVPDNNGNWMVNNLAGSWGMGMQMGYNINIKDNKVKIWFTDDRFKDELIYLTRLYKAGLIDNELFTHDSPKYLAKVNSQNVGVFIIQTDDGFDSKDYQGIAPFKGPNGDQLVSTAGPVARDAGTFAITANNKNPDATMRWIDYFYGDEGSIFFRYGVEGQTYKKLSDGSVEYNDDILNDKRGKATAIGQFTIWPGGGAPHLISEKNSSAINSKATQAAQQAFEPYLPKAVYAAPIFDEASRVKALTIKADITKYYNEVTARFILGDLSFDKWGEYVSTMEKLGIKDLEAIYQKAYDNMNK